MKLLPLFVAAFLPLLAQAADTPGAAAGFTRKVLQDQDISVAGHHAVVAQIDFAAGAAVGRHVHPGEELGYVVAGAVVIEIDGKPAPRVQQSKVARGGRQQQQLFARLRHFRMQNGEQRAEAIRVVVVIEDHRRITEKVFLLGRVGAGEVEADAGAEICFPSSGRAVARPVREVGPARSHPIDGQVQPLGSGQP